MLDLDFIKRFTEAPSIGTACGPAYSILNERFGSGYTRTFVPDAFCLYQKSGSDPSRLRAVFIAHVDEVGGCVYGPRRDGSFNARAWGNEPRIFARAPLQAFDYLARDPEEAYEVTGVVVTEGDEERISIHGERV